MNLKSASNVASTAAAPAVKASELFAGRVSIELAALAVVPMTCRSDNPASFLLDFDPCGLDGVDRLKGKLDGVSLVQGALILELAGVLMAMKND